MQAVRLLPHKDLPIRARHHWIFSGAVTEIPAGHDGEILPVVSNNGELLGHAYFNSQSNIVGRMVSFGETSPLIALEQAVKRAVALRLKLFDSSTNCYRLINGEGDELPGLVVDRYANVLVIQISTLGMERLKSWICEVLMRETGLDIIYEKSSLPSRRAEGLEPQEGLVRGQLPTKLIVRENSLQFKIDLPKSQKTGLFLDQREMRTLVGQLAAGQRVLNCFAYTGGFSLYAAANGATAVTTVDIAEGAVRQAEENFGLNNLTLTGHEFIAADVFDFLHEDRPEYDLVILDPPAFAKKKNDVANACRGYREINRLALGKMPAGSILLTCSCSYHVDAELFQKVVMQAAQSSGKRVRIIGKHILAPDHPINIFHPEANYLKSLLLYVD